MGWILRTLFDSITSLYHIKLTMSSFCSSFWFSVKRCIVRDMWWVMVRVVKLCIVLDLRGLAKGSFVLDLGGNVRECGKTKNNIKPL